MPHVSTHRAESGGTQYMRQISDDDDANPVDVDAAIAAMRQTHLQCRDFGHSWRPMAVERIPQRRQWLQALRCVRCRTVRQRLLDEYGHQLSAQYIYAKGYVVNGLGRLTGEDRDHLRLASLMALISADTTPREG